MLPQSAQRRKMLRMGRASRKGAKKRILERRYFAVPSLEAAHAEGVETVREKSRMSRAKTQSAQRREEYLAQRRKEDRNSEQMIRRGASLQRYLRLRLGLNGHAAGLAARCSDKAHSRSPKRYHPTESTIGMKNCCRPDMQQRVQLSKMLSLLFLSFDTSEIL